MNTQWTPVMTKLVASDLTKVAFALRGVELPIPTHELNRAIQSQKETILSEGITYGEEGNYFVKSQIGDKECWVIVDDYGEQDAAGQETPGTRLFVQTILYPEEY